MATLREQILLHKKLDEYDVYRDYFNESIEKCITAGRQGIEQEMYITVRYDVSNSYENAKAYFTTLENSMITAFREIGSTLTPLDATERLRILHDFYRFGNEEYFQFNFKMLLRRDLISKMQLSIPGWIFLQKHTLKRITRFVPVCT